LKRGYRPRPGVEFAAAETICTRTWCTCYKSGRNSISSTEQNQVLIIDLWNKLSKWNKQVLPQISFISNILLQGSGWKIVASLEGNFPNRIKELPLDRHFDINNVKNCAAFHHFLFLLHALRNIYVASQNVFYCVYSIRLS